MKFPNLALAVVLSVPFALPASLFAQGATSEQIVDIAGASFAPVIEQYRIPGLVVGITWQGQHSFYATGVAARKGHVAATPDTIFELGSISKIFTATLAALAEDRGMLDLDAPVSDSIPQLEGAAFGGQYARADPLARGLATAATGDTQLFQCQHRLAGAYHGTDHGYVLCPSGSGCAVSRDGSWQHLCRRAG